MATKYVPFAVLDPDDQGARLCLLASYHGFYKERWNLGEVTNEDYAETMYLLGNMEGRLMYNHVTQDDIEMMDLWQKELEESAEDVSFMPIPDTPHEINGGTEDPFEMVEILLRLRSRCEFHNIWARAAYTTAHELVVKAMNNDLDGIQMEIQGGDEMRELQSYLSDYHDYC